MSSSSGELPPRVHTPVFTPAATHLPPKIPKIASAGIVLAGPGTTADFGVGAVTYLFNNGFVSGGDRAPPVLAGASLSALNAAKLAEGTPSALQELQNFWLGLMQIGDLYLQQPWLIASPAWVQEAIAMALQGGNLASVQLPDILQQLVSSKPYAEIKGVAAIANAAQVPGAGVVSGVLGVISFVAALFDPTSSQPTDLAKLYNNLIANTALFDPTPLQNLIGQQINFNNIRNSGIKLRLAVGNLDDGMAYYFDEKFATLELDFRSNQIVSAPGTASPPQAVMACGTAPGVLPPVGMNGMDLVEAGIRQSVPLLAAIVADAKPIYAIVSAPEKVASVPGGFFANGSGNVQGLLGIVQRANDISGNGIQEFSIAPPPPEALIIQPSFDIHWPFGIDPGLVSIAMAYGHMRAAEVANGAYALRPLSDQIIARRLLIWALENQAMALDYGRWAQQGITNPSLRPPPHSGPQPPPGLAATNDAVLVSYIRNLKLDLRSVICQYTQSPLFQPGFFPATDFRLPQEIAQINAMRAPFNGSDFRAWYMHWERHPYQTTTATPYDEFTDFQHDLRAAPLDELTAMLNPCTPVEPFPLLTS